jgi:2-hydroxy-3-keto-5-methylthiopentenyl-1-phosphate phosphatase
VKRIVFCDFDGTITVQETFVAMLKRFTPEVADQILPEIYAKRVTLREGVRQMLESIPSSSYPKIIEFTRSQPIRAGFLDLLTFLNAQNIPFVVVSGGLQGMVEAALEPFDELISAIYAVDVNTAGVYLRVNSRYEGGTEMVAKAQIMTTYEADETIAIGDSITDWNLALAASIVFARPSLTNFLEEHSKPYMTWTDFIDVREQIAERIKGK